MHKKPKYLIFPVELLLFFSISSTSAFAASETSFRYTSQPGSYIGEGKSGLFTRNDATFSISGNSADLTLLIDSTKGESWSINLVAPKGEKLHLGRYFHAERAAFKTGRSPGLDVSGNGGGCNEVWGNFYINQIATGKAGNITMLDANFSQSCEFPKSPKINGIIKYNAKPLSFSFKSDPSDFVGGGVTRQYTNAASIFSLTGDKTVLTYNVSGNRDDWTAMIEAPTGKTLEAGIYKTARFADNTHAGLDFFGNSRGCNQSVGSLIINSISYKANGNVSRLNASFVQRCEEGVAALRGNIRYYE